MNKTKMTLTCWAFVIMLLSIGLCSTASLSASPLKGAADNTIMYATCIATSVNMRSKPSTDGKIVAQANEGDQFKVLEQSGDWLKLETKDGKSGWSMKKFFQIKWGTEEPQITKPRYEVKKPTAPQPAQGKKRPVSRARATEPSYAFGVRAGIALAHLSGADISDDFSSKMGFTVGGLVYRPFNRRFGLQIEANYIMKGAKKKTNGTESIIKLDYIDVPVLLRITLMPGSKSSPYLAMGPVLSFNTQAVADRDGTVQEITDVKKMDFGLAIGGGLRTGSLVIDARYGLGLNQIHDESSDQLDLKNQCITLALGWMF